MKSLTPIILISAAVLLLFFHLEPEYEKLVDLQDEGQRFENLLNQADELRMVRENLRDKRENFSDESLEQLEILLPNDFNLVAFVHDLDGVASRHNLPVNNISHSTESMAEGDLNRAIIGFSFQTSHSNFLNFLADLEQSMRIIDVTSVQIRTPSDQNNVHDYNLTTQTYWVR